MLAIAGTLRGTSIGTLTANAQKAVLVQLEPTASITGTVRAPNDAPVTAGTVSGGGGLASFNVPISPDGTFRVDNLNFGAYTLTAYDSAGRVRARVTTPIILATPNQVASTSMKFVGLGRSTAA